MSYFLTMAGLPWDWFAMGGGLGGALSAAISSNLTPFPAWLRSLDGGRFGPMTRVGLLVSSAVGAASALGVLLALQGTAEFDDVSQGRIPGRLLAFSLIVGFLAARSLTNEVDKVLLRLAVRDAASAPAAHPEITHALDSAPPYAVYEMAAGLKPRRPASPPGRVHVTSRFEGPHPQRL
jgi:hypothetical protein